MQAQEIYRQRLLYDQLRLGLARVISVAHPHQALPLYKSKVACLKQFRQACFYCINSEREGYLFNREDLRDIDRLLQRTLHQMRFSLFAQISQVKNPTKNCP